MEKAVSQRYVDGMKTQLRIFEIFIQNETRSAVSSKHTTNVQYPVTVIYPAEL